MRWTNRMAAGPETAAATQNSVTEAGERRPLGLERAKASLQRGRWLAAGHRREDVDAAAVGALAVGAEAVAVQAVGARAMGAGATGALAIGSLALGTLAVGAVAVGAFAIGRLSVRRARIGTAEIGRLTIGRLEVESFWPPDGAHRRPPAGWDA
jgi:hypothetical protein